MTSNVTLFKLLWNGARVHLQIMKKMPAVSDSSLNTKTHAINTAD